MRKMITSKKEQQLLDMTESVFESGIWGIPSGTTGDAGVGLPKVLKDLEAGYQYKIYLNVKGAHYSISRFETEIGISQSYISFIDTKYIEFASSITIDGASNCRMLIRKKTSSTLSCDLRFTGTTTAEVSFRYLITRSKLYF